jgi:hypothetical protein
VALTLHSEDYKALAMSPFMLEFLVTNLEKESEEYLARWEVGWKSRINCRPPASWSTVSQESSSAPFPSEARVEGGVVQQTKKNERGCAQKSKQEHEDGDGGEASDGSWETQDEDGGVDADEDDEVDNRHDHSDATRAPADDNCAPAPTTQPSRSQKSFCSRDWEACEHRFFTHLQQQCQTRFCVL